MWAFVEVAIVIVLTVLGALLSFALGLLLVQYIKELLVELEWIHPKPNDDDDDDDDNDESWEGITYDK